MEWLMYSTNQGDKTIYSTHTHTATWQNNFAQLLLCTKIITCYSGTPVSACFRRSRWALPQASTQVHAQNRSGPSMPMCMEPKPEPVSNIIQSPIIHSCSSFGKYIHPCKEWEGSDDDDGDDDDWGETCVADKYYNIYIYTNKDIFCNLWL